MTRVRTLRRRLEQLKASQGPTWYEDRFEEDGLQWIRFGHVFANGDHGPAVEVPLTVKSHAEWERIAEELHQRCLKDRGAVPGNEAAAPDPQKTEQ